MCSALVARIVLSMRVLSGQYVLLKIGFVFGLACKPIR
jgi:hypothetical protein